MILKRISILNYKNLEQVELLFRLKLNTFSGRTGWEKPICSMRSTFCLFVKVQEIRSIRRIFVMIRIFSLYKDSTRLMDGTPEEIYCGMKRRQKKQFKRNKKEYYTFVRSHRFIAFGDGIACRFGIDSGGSDERRRFMDVVISQYDKEYLDALIRYNKALVQRNTLLKSESRWRKSFFSYGRR